MPTTTGVPKAFTSRPTAGDGRREYTQKPVAVAMNPDKRPPTTTARTTGLREPELVWQCLGGNGSAALQHRARLPLRQQRESPWCFVESRRSRATQHREWPRSWRQIGAMLSSRLPPAHDVHRMQPNSSRWSRRSLIFALLVLARRIHRGTRHFYPHRGASSLFHSDPHR